MSSCENGIEHPQIVGSLLTGLGAVQFTRTNLHVVCVFNILSHVVYDVGD